MNQDTEPNIEPGTVESAVNSLLTPASEEAPVEAVEENQVELDAVEDTAEEETVQEFSEETEVEEPVEENIPELYTVKVDGVEEEWTLDQLKRSASGQGKIQKNMQETARLRKEVEQNYAQLEAERAQIQQALQTVQNQFASQELKKPSMELLETDPIGYQVEKAKYDEQLEQRQILAQEQQRQALAQEAQTKQAMSVYVAEQAKLLTEKIPEFGKPETANKLKTDLVQAGQAYGFSADEIGAIVDARTVQVLHDANKWRQLQASKGSVENKVQKARPIVKSGAKQVGTIGRAKKAQEASSRFKKTGSVADATLAILQGG